MPAVRAEQGCIEYEATIDAAPELKFQAALGPETFVVVEKWENAESLEAHLAAPHMAAYGGKVRDMIASRMIHVLSPVNAR